MKGSLRVLVAAACCALGAGAHALTLEDAIAAAEKNDPTLASARANRDAAFENIAIARAKLLPQTSFQGMVQKIQEGVKQDAASGGSIGSSYLVNAYNNQFSLRQGLYHPRDWMGYDIGKLQSEYGNEKLASARSDLWMRTANAWIDVLTAVEARRIYEQTVSITAEAADQAERRFKAGDGTRDAVVEAQAQAALARSQLTEAQITERSRLQSFRLLTGIEATDLQDWHLPDYRSLHLSVENQAELRKAADELNPEILAARAAEEINRKRAEQARADRLPTVDLVASKSWAQNDTVFTINQRYTVLGAGLQVNIPLYDGGGLSATQRQAELSALASREDMRAQQLKLDSQVENDWAAAEASLERARSAQLLWQSALEQKKAAEMGLKSGVRTWGDIAQADILIARRASDFLGYAAGVLHAQARLLSTLPVTENLWEPWVAQISLLARPGVQPRP
ncbi:MAG: TolC family protein [Betaproteobacteria bacterium]|nr:TolC family protein [Betaproteobacteria bacterium]MDE2622403.1 TolC family protein [Betaproteobacteria bacterium]